MKTMEEAVDAASQVFGNEGHITIPPEEKPDYRETLTALGLDQHLKAHQDDIKYRRLKALGLPEVTIKETLEMMVGDPITLVQVKRNTNEYHQLHYWGGPPKNANDLNDLYYRLPNTYTDIKAEHPELIVFDTIEGRFQFQVGDPNYLKSKIPYGVLLLMKELKDSNLADCFFAVAPLHCWRPGEAIPNTDPVIVASVRTTDLSYRHFFLAHWTLD